ncbi:phosphatidylserine/phosphatidylglycerophosphate/cardiolipin synthase family protein [Nitrosovibrio sp. Nv17]|uniref:phospholipase D-like domain-containing protein n=1 Tax=Nitrosovibrio sp. Nv17 TaxID=1855339 RepID=UPI0009089D79|nr:phospholipase D-like domain-containing protein [Nitrosovibrio sp. Nv17]SFW32696.1 cardiolipin synthase [Nitrosovibrio sp. Nv17]
MNRTGHGAYSRDALPAARILAAQAFSRAAGAPLVHGNGIRLLRDGNENYAAWLDAIQAAERSIHFENYIIHDDPVGRRFAEAFIAKAKAGVQVRVLYDWLGSLPEASRDFWRRLSDGGVAVRCFNPPRLDSPLGWISRLHRKSLCVDDRVAFISGLCVGQMWEGYPERGIPPWRDTGVEVRGPVVADVVRAFFHAWAEAGAEAFPDGLPQRDSIPAAGNVDLRVLASATATAGLYRLEQLITVLAQKTLWLTDAYFVGTASYVQALRGAAKDGVDVRLLVPGSSGDLQFLRPVSRAGYRPLLEAGVRVFEWNGSMLHAKTAVADGRWARVGSSNLNIASWLGNWELDVAVEDAGFAQEMERMYLEDLDNATEIVLGRKNRVQAVGAPPALPPVRRSRERRRSGSAGQLTAGAIRVSNTVGAALTNRLVLGAAEAKIMASGGAILLGMALLALFEPLLLVAPFALFAGWIGVSLLIQAYTLHRGTHAGAASDHPGSRIEPFLSREEPSEDALADPPPVVLRKPRRKPRAPAGRTRGDGPPD